MLTQTDHATQGDTQCRRAACRRPVVGRGLCAPHYGRWQLELDPLALPGDKTPPPARAVWRD
ncbi:MAG: hypothetical protein ACRDQF_15890 [Thermocrispum sp.]